mmetsp:Transcript_68426/g.121057  ORF Transcript_68426/g.121057 Transcript_68426/m.121057 type:complete len:207 (-) Transcript_68426:1843-2463(-)
MGWDTLSASSVYTNDSIRGHWHEGTCIMFKHNDEGRIENSYPSISLKLHGRRCACGCPWVTRKSFAQNECQISLRRCQLLPHLAKTLQLHLLVICRGFDLFQSLKLFELLLKIPDLVAEWLEFFFTFLRGARGFCCFLGTTRGLARFLLLLAISLASQQIPDVRSDSSNILLCFLGQNHTPPIWADYLLGLLYLLFLHNFSWLGCT